MSLLIQNYGDPGVAIISGRNKTIAKPFIKWVGGKTQLLEEVKKSLPSDMNQ